MLWEISVHADIDRLSHLAHVVKMAVILIAVEEEEKHKKATRCRYKKKMPSVLLEVCNSNSIKLLLGFCLCFVVTVLFPCYFILAMKKTPNDQQLLISSVVA